MVVRFEDATSESIVRRPMGSMSEEGGRNRSRKGSSHSSNLLYIGKTVICLKEGKCGTAANCDRYETSALLSSIYIVIMLTSTRQPACVFMLCLISESF